MRNYLSVAVDAPGGLIRHVEHEPSTERIVLTSANGTRVAVESFRATVYHGTRYESAALTVDGLSLRVRAEGRRVRKTDGGVGFTRGDVDLPWGDPTIPQAATNELYRLLVAAAEQARADAVAAVEFLTTVDVPAQGMR